MAKRTRKFKTEVQQLLDLVIHSLYSKKEIYLRELISNSSDAIDRLRFEALTDPSLLGEDEDWKIKIKTDTDARTITVSDNGIGMAGDELDTSLGTIASSGTRTFLEALQENKDKAPAELIGQFGVGFYASFMVADKVTVVTRRAGSEEALCWTSTGGGSYTVQEAEKETRGTDVTLHLREGTDEFLQEWQIRQTVKRFSDYIAYPVVMDVERTEKDEDDKEVTRVEEETLNSMKAIWKKAKREVSEEEYKEFYHHISHDYGDPLCTLHYAAEGTTEFRALLYVPKQAPMDLFFPNAQRGIHLYVRNVFITDECKDLLPEYLRFVRGVVDSSDLPLNVSREMLQDHAIIRRIQKSLVGKVLGELDDLKSADREAYTGFFRQFGRLLKEGVHFDFENHDKLKDLLMYESSKTEEGKPIFLREYVDRMPSSQKEIYYVSGDGRQAAASSPHLEAFRARDFEVLFFTEPMDDWVAQRLTEYDGKKLKAIDQGDIELGDEDERKEAGKKHDEAAETYKDLLAFVKAKLDDDVKEVRLSKRLTDSIACLVADDMGMTAGMERLMRAMNQEIPPQKRILELNPEHGVLERMQSMYADNKDDPRLADYIDLVYDQALVAEGAPVRDPARFTSLVSKLMAE